MTNEEDRSLRFQAEGRVLSLYGGKITGIFDAAERVLFVVRCSEFQECPTIEPM